MRVPAGPGERCEGRGQHVPDRVLTEGVVVAGLRTQDAGGDRECQELAGGGRTQVRGVGQEMRDAIRALLVGETGAAERLTGVTATHAVRIAFEPEDGALRIRVVPAGTRPELPVVATVLTALQAAAQDGRLSRLRICQRPDCGWAY